MSNLLRSLAAGAKAVATGNVSSLTGYDEKKGRQEYNLASKPEGQQVEGQPQHSQRQRNCRPIQRTKG